jgi:integrase
MTTPNKRSKGQGSVYYRASDNRWCGTLALPSPDGRRRRKTVTVNPEGLTEQQAIKKVEALLLIQLRKLKAEGDIATSTQTLGSWIDVWFRTIALKKVRPKTAATYRSLIETHIKPAIGSVQLAKLTPTHVRRVEERITTTLKNKNNPDLGYLSSTTAMQAHRIVAVALKYAEREGRVTKNVATLTDAPRRARRDLTILTADDAMKVLLTVRDDRLRSRWAAAFYTGARQGELLGLEFDRVTDELDLSWQLQRLSWEHGCGGGCGHKSGTGCPKRKVTFPPDWDHRYLHGGFWLSRPKSQAGYRIIPLVDPLRGMIEQRIADASTEPNPHGLLWTSNPKRNPAHTGMLPLDGLPIDPSWDNKEWHRVLARAGVPDARLHDARHTAASMLRKAGVPIGTITLLLGHSTQAMSEAYIDTDREQTRAAMVSLSRQLQIGTDVPPLQGTNGDSVDRGAS